MLFTARVPSWRQVRVVSAALLAVAFVGGPAAAREAKEAKVAVAANFTAPSKEIAAAFEKAKGHKIVLSFGSTGQLYTQITQAAPFDVFLAADQATPKKAVDEGKAVPESRFTYAVGKLVLFSKSKDLVTGEATLKDGKFQKIAIANPVTAPYGTAAVATMKALGVYDTLSPKIVQGNNIAQTFQFIDSGNAELGFVALSQVIKVEGGSRWIVPGKYHDAIAQDAVLLKTAADNDAAREFLAFLKGPEARAVIEKYGYGVGQ
ncbi:MAG: molybdate ABC transporter substrate-binding protein [Hyphomicrobiaceae bacterium]